MVKKKTLKRLFVAIGVILVVAVAGVMFVAWMISRPLYTVGAVRAGENLRGPLEPPPQTDRSVWQVESDIRLHFEAFGEGPPILVVHGGPGVPYSKPWAGLESMTDRFTLYYYHQRGCGDSTRPFDRFESKNFYANMTKLERTLGIGAQVADIERIRRILKQDKLTLIGHSFGGFLASMYAAEFPDHVEKLVLVAPAGVLTPPDEKRDLFQQARAKLPNEQLADYDAFLAEYFDFGEIFTKSESELVALNQRGGRFILAAMGEDLDASPDGPTGGGWMVHAMYFSMGKSFDYRAPLRKVTAPVLIVHGEDDQLSIHGSRMYETCFPNTKFVTQKAQQPAARAGHFVFDDSASEFGAVVGAFLLE